MKQRIITALILAPLVVLGIFLLPMPLFIVAITAIAFIGFWEWTQFINPNFAAKQRILNLIPAAFVMVLSLFIIPFSTSALSSPSMSHQLILLGGCIWWVIASVLALTYPKSTPLWQHNQFLKHAFSLLALLPFIWSVLLLRATDYSTDIYHGAKLVLYVCLLVWTADSGAYFTGKAFGKHKMAPKVSPNKTLEGLLGGIVFAMIIGWIAANLLGITFTSITSMLIITSITVVISVLGDLVESMFKRESGIKDSSNIIPGHGGVLDRIDSLIAALPVFAYLYLN